MHRRGLNDGDGVLGTVPHLARESHSCLAKDAAAIVIFRQAISSSIARSCQS
jgi:hypothetical protein